MAVADDSQRKRTEDKGTLHAGRRHVYVFTSQIIDTCVAGRVTGDLTEVLRGEGLRQKSVFRTDDWGQKVVGGKQHVQGGSGLQCRYKDALC